MNLSLNGGKLFDQNPQVLNSIKRIIKSKWLDVLKNLPSIKNKDLTLKEDTIKKFENSDDPAGMAIDFMVVKAISIKELLESFEALNLEEGLLFLGKPETEMKIIRFPNSLVESNLGEPLEIFCYADGFPTPTYEYSKNEIQICHESLFKIESTLLSDVGDYKCVVTQKRKTGLSRKEINFKLIVNKKKESEPLNVTLPTKQEANIGDDTFITALCNVDVKLLKFEWYKFNKQTRQEEILLNNSTYNTNCLQLKNFDLKNAGVYRCRVSRESTNEIVFSKKTEMVVANLSEFDLKMALIIGNSNYETDDEEIKLCKKCSNVTPSYNLTNLNLCTAFGLLKQRLESFGYLVLSFLDLDADSYLRALQVAKQISNKARSTSVLIYVAGHGHNYVKEDFLIPIDTKILLHNNNHEYRRIYNSLNLCSLSNLLENFKPKYPEQNISIACFWDLCRRTWIECPSDIDPSFKENLDYSIMFCCNVGNNGYEINKDDKELNLRKGPIFLNVLLNNLKPNMTLHDIGIKMKHEIQHMKEIRPNFDKLNNLIFFSTLENHLLSDRANKNSEYEESIKTMYFNENSQKGYFSYKDSKIFSYRFRTDIFINTILLEIEMMKPCCTYTFQYQTLIFMDKIESTRPNIILFRIRNFLAAKKFNLNLPIILFISHDNISSSVEIKFPDDIYRIYDCMNTPYIDKIIEEKKKLDISDAMSVSSVDVESESFDTPDELTS